MSLGMVRGRREEPMQMIESVVQVHPEGHLNTRFARHSWNELTNSKVSRRHFRMEDNLQLVGSMALKRSVKSSAPLLCPAQRTEMQHQGLTWESAALMRSVLDCPITGGLASPITQYCQIIPPIHLCLLALRCFQFAHYLNYFIVSSHPFFFIYPYPLWLLKKSFFKMQTTYDLE